MPRKSQKSSSKQKNETNERQSKNQTNSKQSLDRMKMEIANDFGVKLGAESSSKDNGKVGGEMVKRLVGEALNKNHKNNNNNNNR